ncbi:hypothetical protein ACFLRC_04835, partial [Candidatus Altiarchaeota archaeon]
MSNIIRNSRILTLAFTLFLISLVVLVLGRFSYPQETLIWTQYPQRLESNITICIEGDYDPTKQTILLDKLEEEPPPQDIFVSINKRIQEFHPSNFGQPQKTDYLKLGCNNISFSSHEPGTYKATINYTMEWRPILKGIDIQNLRSNEP